jgi:hypothetical protein
MWLSCARALWACGCFAAIGTAVPIEPPIDPNVSAVQVHISLPLPIHFAGMLHAKW